MKTELTLILDDRQGRQRRIAVQSNRFRIGRSEDNDLALDDEGLSRRHALIEKVDGTVQISDCGSQNGTFVNHHPVRGSMTLHDRDIISMGFDCRLVVDIKTSGGADSADAVEVSAARSDPFLDAAPPGFTHSFFSTAVLAMAGVVILLVLAGIMGLLSRESADTARARNQSFGSEANENSNRSTAHSRNDLNRADGGTAEAVSVEQIERAAAQVMRRVSSDDRPYAFPPNASRALEEIKRKVEVYKTSPTLAPALDSLTRGGPTVAAWARREGVEPYLVIYTALAEIEGGRTSLDAAAAARQALPRLLALRAMFGTEMADKSLIIVAAYRMGGGTKKSHPLLETMRRVVKNPLVERNVWYLYERGGINAQVYDFVLSFLASGIIAQNPRQFGIAAAPLVF